MKTVIYGKSVLQQDKPSVNEVNKIYEAGGTRVGNFVIISSDAHTINMFEVERLAEGGIPTYKETHYTVTDYATPDGTIHKQPSWMSMVEFKRNLIIKLGHLPALRKHATHII